MWCAGCASARLMQTRSPGSEPRGTALSCPLEEKPGCSPMRTGTALGGFRGEDRGSHPAWAPLSEKIPLAAGSGACVRPCFCCAAILGPPGLQFRGGCRGDSGHLRMTSGGHCREAEQLERQAGAEAAAQGTERTAPGAPVPQTIPSCGPDPGRSHAAAASPSFFLLGAHVTQTSMVTRDASDGRASLKLQ